MNVFEWADKIVEMHEIAEELREDNPFDILSAHNRRERRHGLGERGARNFGMTNQMAKYRGTNISV